MKKLLLNLITRPELRCAADLEFDLVIEHAKTLMELERDMEML